MTALFTIKVSRFDCSIRVSRVREALSKGGGGGGGSMEPFEPPLGVHSDENVDSGTSLFFDAICLSSPVIIM